VDHFATLGERFRVIAPDTRGSGATVHAGGPVTFDVLSDDVIALIEALELERPVVVGFSEGGATASLVALQRPDLVGALVNHAGFDYFDPMAPAKQFLAPMFGGSPTATTADPDAAERAFQSSPEMAAVFARMRTDYDGAQGKGYWRTYIGQFYERHMAPFGRTIEDLSGLTVPTMFVVGDRDHFCSVELACAAYRATPDASLAVMPDTGHEITTAIIAATRGYAGDHLPGE
jgi:pimeloyl-ACP methyl ester carboxylesterase